MKLFICKKAEKYMFIHGDAMDLSRTAAFCEILYERVVVAKFLVCKFLVCAYVEGCEAGNSECKRH